MKARYTLIRHWLWCLTHPRDARRIARRLRAIQDLVEVNRRLNLENAALTRALANYKGFPHA